MDIDCLDFVYLIKPGEIGTDLRYSLRSIAKHYPNNKVWIVGYKPDWVINVNYLPIEEKNEKWKNLINDLTKACKCSEISDDFIYMNDDFLAINPTISLEEIINSNYGLLNIRAERYKQPNLAKIKWHNAFTQTYDLLDKLNIEKPYYDYELHLPLKINKKKFLEVISLPEVQTFIKTSEVLHYRSLYKNYDKPEKSLTLTSDVKVLKNKDISKQKIKICGWLSMADGLIRNMKFSYLNELLRQNLSQPCKYETIKEKSKKDKYLKF